MARKCRKAAEFLKNCEVYCAENTYLDFDNFDDVIIETSNRLINDCEYDNEKENADVPVSGNYDIVKI